jgi:hypothetical protein
MEVIGVSGGVGLALVALFWTLADTVAAQHGARLLIDHEHLTLHAAGFELAQ